MSEKERSLDQPTESVASTVDRVARRLEEKSGQTERMLRRWFTAQILIAAVLGFVAGRYA